MKNKNISEADIEYWENRTIELKKAELQNEIQYVKELQEQYDKALLTINKQINDWLLKFADNNGNITLEEAKKLLNSKELKELKWDVNDYIKYGRENGTDLIWEKQLVNASSKAHIARLEALEIQIQQQIEKLSNEEQKSTEDFILNQYQDSYYRTAYEIQKGVGVAFNMSSLNLDVINTLINKPWTTDNLTFSDRIWKNKKALIDILQKDLTRSIILGEDNTKIIKKVDDVFHIGKNKAARLVMTESAFFSENARKKCFDDLDVKKYILVATLDSRTSEICQELDGKICNEDEFKVGETAPPFHPWCRTTTAPYVERLYNKGFRSARDPETGKTYTIPSNLTYKQWKEQYIDKNEVKKKAYDLTRKSAQNHSSDFDQWQRYRNVLKDEVPNSLDKFQELKYNNSGEWKELKANYGLKKHYDTAIENGDLSPLVDFNLYKDYNKRLDSELNGIKLKNGLEVKSHSLHFIDRTFGSSAFPEKGELRSGVNIEDTKETLLTSTDIVKSKRNDSLKIYGKKCIVSINPNTGNLIQVNPQ